MNNNKRVVLLNIFVENVIQVLSGFFGEWKETERMEQKN